MISLIEAQKIIIREIETFHETEKVPLLESVGRVLAEDVIAPFAQPPFSNSAMDGFALRVLDVQDASEKNPVTLEVMKFQSAGSSFCELPLHAIYEIATGAPLPLGADAVMMKEEASYQEGKITVKRRLSAGENVRKKGENIVEGTPVFLRGEKILEKNIGLLASFGFDLINVMRRPLVCYFATGNEIVKVGKPREDYQIYNSNALSLHALFQKEGCEFLDLGICKDSLSEHISLIKKARDVKPDILAMTGGVSVGEHDFVKEALEEIGAEILFHKVSIKPGKPILFARLNHVLIFGLPGNPVSTQVGFYYFIYPTIRKLLGQRECFLREEKAFLQGTLFQEKRHLLLPGIKRTVDGVSSVIPLKQGSGNVAAFSLGNCFISVPSKGAGEGKLNENSMVSIQDYS